MRTVILAAALLLAGCNDKVQNTPDPGTNIAIHNFEWRIRDAATLRAQYEAAGMAPGEQDRLYGFAGIDTSTGARVVYTLPPKQVNDDITCTLGHEVMHLALGDYHTPPK